MTERPRPRRLSRWTLRALAWIAEALAFLSPFAGLTISPKPATAEQSSGDGARRVIVVRRITRRVIVQPAPERQPVRYVYVGGGSSGGSAPASGGYVSSAVAAPPPATSTGGS